MAKIINSLHWLPLQMPHQCFQRFDLLLHFLRTLSLSIDYKTGIELHPLGKSLGKKKLSSIFGKNIGRAGDRTSDLLFSSPVSHRLR